MAVCSPCWPETGSPRGSGKRGKQLAEAAGIKIQARLLDGDYSIFKPTTPANERPSVVTFAAFTESWLGTLGFTQSALERWRTTGAPSGLT